jgi:hypothetical protein
MPYICNLRFPILNCGQRPLSGQDGIHYHSALCESSSSGRVRTPPLQGGVGGGNDLNMLHYAAQHALHIFIHIGIRESKDPDAVTLYCLRPLIIAVLSARQKMGFSIKLYREFGLWAIKIKNKPLNTILTPELISAQSLCPEFCPKQPLGKGHILSQFFPPFFHSRSVIYFCHDLPHPASPWQGEVSIRLLPCPERN